MGGKRNQAQRIKNNAKPSNSGRSAELLASTSFPQFSREIRFIPPTLSLLKTEEFDASISPEFQIVLKKMYKKDATTKLKALQELSDLISKAEIDTIKPILNFWSTLYNFLATDLDHRIREAVHNAHYQIILKDKKMIAPILKQVIGPWFTSQYDTYPPAASAAEKAFSAAFPPNKVQDCVIFCQKEILTYIHENITTKIESSQQGNNDDAEIKFERIIISSLQGYCLYLNTLSEEQIKSCEDFHLKIFNNSRFLKLASNKASAIRAACFKVIAMLCHKAPFVLSGVKKQIFSIVFNNLNESEPAVVGHVWEAVLLIMDSNENWWQHINLEENFVKKLHKVLIAGGSGNAELIYPNLLSILHKLPLASRKEDFYDVFFKNLSSGLRRRSQLGSKLELTAIINAYVECLQYVILTNEKEVKLCELLIGNHLVSFVEWNLLKNQNTYKVAFNKISSLVRYWNSDKNLEEGKSYETYLEIFWNKLQELLELVAENFEQSANLPERQRSLLVSLKTLPKSRENQKVRFADTASNNETETKSVTNVINQVYEQNVGKMACTVLKSYVSFVNKNKSKEFQQYIFALIQIFESKIFLEKLSVLLKSNNDPKIFDLYDKLLRNWLMDEELCSETVVNLTFIVLKYLDEDLKYSVLMTFFELLRQECFEWCIKNAFSEPHNRDSTVQKWIKHEKISQFLVDVAEETLHIKIPESRKTLFKLVFTPTNGGLLIEEGTVSSIINKILKPLSRPEEYHETLNSCLHLVARLCQEIYLQNDLKCGHDLVLSLFKLTLHNHNNDNDHITEDTLSEVRTSWELVVGILSTILEEEVFLKLTEKFADTIEEKFTQNVLADLEINHLKEVILSFIRQVYKERSQTNQNLLIKDIINVFFNRNFALSWKDEATRICIAAEYLHGNLASPWEHAQFKLNRQIDEDNILKYFIWSYLKSLVLSSSVNDFSEMDCGDVETSEKSHVEIISFLEDDVSSLTESGLVLTDLLYDLATGKSFLENYKMSRHATSVSLYHNLSKDKVKYMMKVFETYGIADKIKTILVEKLQNESWLWCKTVYFLHTEIMQTKHLTKVYQTFKKLTPANKLGLLHLTQIFGNHLDFDYVEFTGRICEDVIILRSLINCPEIDVQVAEVYEKLRALRVMDTQKFSFEIFDLTWRETENLSETARLFTALIEKEFTNQYRSYWDFSRITLTSWMINIYKHRSYYENAQVQAFIIAICNIYITLHNHVKRLGEIDPNSDLVDEWNNVFIPNIYPNLLRLWVFFSEQLPSKQHFPITLQTFLREFGKIIELLDCKFVFESYYLSLPHWSKIVKRCCTLFLHSEVILQLWGYKMLLLLVPGLVEIDSKLTNADTVNIKGFTCEHFKEMLLQSHNIVNQILDEFKLAEDTCQIKPYTDAYSYTFGYLLLWCVLFKMCEKSTPELRYQYADWLKNENIFKGMLNHLFKLMPEDIFSYNEGKVKSCLKYFQQQPNLDFEEPYTSEYLEQLACWIYASSLSLLPTLVRQWWSETDSKVCQVVEKVTALYISPQLCQQELLDVARNEVKFKNMTIKTLPAVREVIAIYTVDEAQMELVITLPPNYPLGGPDVRCVGQVGGAAQKQWLMQLKRCLLHQNGRIWDGLSLWNHHLDKKFDGVEECYICYMVLHQGTYQMPKLTCPTCKKKFHSICLYKWFSTSNQSTCPTCRNLF